MNERIAALMAAAEQDESLQQALRGASSVAEIVQVAAAHGVPVTAHDLASASDVDASDVDLEGSAAVKPLITAWNTCYDC